MLPPAELARLVTACEHLHAKPLVIELARGAHPPQPMLDKVVQAPDLMAALAVAATAAQPLRTSHLLVVEIPKLPAAPRQGL